MSNTLSNQQLFSRYLKILNVPERTPFFGYLKELVLAHLTRIPFENISKIYYKKIKQLEDIPPLNLYLEGIEKFNLGGTCYSNNYYFYLLLSYLGFSVKLCGADMSLPDVHMVSVVFIDGDEYIVDGGYAAPFLIPIPRSLNHDYEIVLGDDRYVLKPMDSKGCSKMEQYRNGEYIHGYFVKPEPKKIEDFNQVIKGSFREDAVFFNSLLLTRFCPDRSVVIHNLNLVESEGANSKSYEIKDRKQLIDLIEEKFGIPKSISEKAISEIKELKNPWS
jgi:N-hydroxyarylamine O-acetyltransferase